MPINRFWFALALAGLMAVVSTEAASASTIHTFKFSAADLLNNQFADGADGSTAADNDLYAGARSLQYHESPDHEQAATTFHASQHALFSDRWASYAAGGYVLDEFTLWGLGGEGRASAWGEDFKPLNWLSVTTPEGWSVEMLRAPMWPELPDDPHTREYPRFVGGFEAGFALDADLEALATQRFTVTIEFDDADAWWGGDTQGDGLADAPNDLEHGPLTMWFGGWVTQYDAEGGFADYHRYEGNFTSIAPSPGAAGAGLIGMLMMLAMRRPSRLAQIVDAGA